MSQINRDACISTQNIDDDKVTQQIHNIILMSIDIYNGPMYTLMNERIFIHAKYRPI